MTFDPKFNRGHLLVMTNLQTKFEVPRPKRSLVFDRKPDTVRYVSTDGQPDDYMLPRNFSGSIKNNNKYLKMILVLGQSKTC
jgi:hypothetical protein